jgi:hypothetical protein
MYKLIVDLNDGLVITVEGKDFNEIKTSAQHIDLIQASIASDREDLAKLELEYKIRTIADHLDILPEFQSTQEPVIAKTSEVKPVKKRGRPAGSKKQP